MREQEYKEYQSRLRQYKNDQFNVKDKLHEMEKLIDNKNKEYRDADEELDRIQALIQNHKAKIDL